MQPTEAGVALPARKRRKPVRSETMAARLAYAVLMAAGALYVWHALHWNINWDEFNFLAGIYATQEGREQSGLNDFHSIIYFWLPFVPGNEIDQIIVARVAQLGFFAAAMAVIFMLARKFFIKPIALIVVVLCVTYTDLIRHAFSFRFDTLCLFFSLTAVYLFYAGKSLMTAAVSGVALAISTLVSVKTVFYIVPLGILGLYLIGKRAGPRHQIARLVTLAACAAIFFILVFFLRGIAGPSGATSAAETGASALETLHRYGVKMFLTEGLLPKADYLARGMAQNAGHWLLIFTGLLTASVIAILGVARRHQVIMMLVFLLPLASILLYRNSFAYFYVYVLPPAMIPAGFALDSAYRLATRHSSRIASLLLMAAIAGPVITAGQFLLLEPRQGTDKQRRIVSTVHQIFPEGTPYIGAHGMVASFPRHGFFMSTWGMESYHSRGKPIFQEILREHQPKFLLRTHPALTAVSGVPPDPENLHLKLLQQDQRVLRENFVHHWGPISVPGKRIRLDRPHEPTRFELLVSGPYTLVAEHPVIINNNTISPGNVMELEAGIHIVYSARAAGNAELITLKWGDKLTIPSREAPPQPLYEGL